MTTQVSSGEGHSRQELYPQDSELASESGMTE